MSALRFKHRQGSTLIEILVVGLIIVLLSGVSLVGYNRFQERQTVVRTARDLVTDLRSAQQRALAGEKPAGWCNGASERLAGWQLKFTSVTLTSTTYELGAVCSSGGISAGKTVTTAGATVSGGTPATLFFSALTGNDPALVADETIVLIGTAAGSNTYSVNIAVTPSGAVKGP